MSTVVKTAFKFLGSNRSFGYSELFGYMSEYSF